MSRLASSAVERYHRDGFLFPIPVLAPDEALGLRRRRPGDHRGAQAVLHGARPVIAAAALEVIDRDVGQISSCTPLLDVMAMRHEEAELRLFAS